MYIYLYKIHITDFIFFYTMSKFCENYIKICFGIFALIKKHKQKNKAVTNKVNLLKILVFLRYTNLLS